MADLSDLLIKGATQSAQNMGAGMAQSAVGGAQAGAELAMRKQQLDMQQQQMQIHLLNVKNEQDKRLMDFIQDAKNYKNAADRKAYLKNVQGYAASMGRPDAAQIASSFEDKATDEKFAKLKTLHNMVEAGSMAPDQYFKTVGNPQLFSQVPSAPLEEVNYDVSDKEGTEALKDAANRAN
jgi:hypothetical protein